MNSPLFLFAALCAIAYLGLTGQRPSLLRSVTKTASVALLALAAFNAWAPDLLVLALALCAIGDLCLSREGERPFMAGIGAFALGHLGFAVLFLTAPGSDPSAIFTTSSGIIVALLVLIGLVMARILAPRAGDLKGPVLIYIPVILLMGIAALAVPDRTVLVSAFAFIVSDMVLAAETFLLPETRRVRRVTPYLIWPLYWGAQAGFFVAFT